MNISNIQPSKLPYELLTPPVDRTPAGDASGSFSALVRDLMKSTEVEQDQVSHEAERVMTGEASNFHEISLAVARADISFRFMMEVRDQLVGAYREVMRTQV